MPLGRLVDRARVFAAGMILAGLGGSSASAAYWNLFNNEGESTVSAEFITYATLTDMLNDENRTGFFVPDGAFIGRNIVGTGSDGTLYWNLFNNEGESTVSAEFITYATLTDMLNDENRLGFFVPDGAFVGRNVVGTGADVLPRGVPEPGTVGLLASAFLGLGVLRRRVCRVSTRKLAVYS